MYHWRYNLLELAKAGHRVFALDMLGFGKHHPRERYAVLLPHCNPA